MSIQFKSLFTLQILHDYYNRHNNKCPDFDIVAADDCAERMKNMQVLHRNFGNKLLTVIAAEKLTETGLPPVVHYIPFLPFGNSFVLRYYMVLKNAHFGGFTAVGHNLFQKKRLYFSNLTKNKIGSTCALSGTVPVHTISKNYAAGNLVKGPDGNFYEALCTSDNSAESKDITNLSYWKKAAANNPYANDGDEVIICGSSFTYTLKTPASNNVIKVFGIDAADAALPFNKLLETIEQTFTQNINAVSIDLRKHKTGKYKLVVNGEADTWIYIDEKALTQNVYGIIEIHHFDNVPADFKLLNAEGRIKNPEQEFTIWFKNRSVTWQYISQNGDIAITDSAATPQVFTPASAAIVKSATAIALTETPIATLTATKTPGGKQIKNLKNPDVEKLVFEVTGNTGFYAANMYVKIDT